MTSTPHDLIEVVHIFPSSPINRNAGKVVTMSGGLDVLQMKEEDVLKFLAAGTHLGGTNLDFQMDQYVYKRKSDGEWWGTANIPCAQT